MNKIRFTDEQIIAALKATDGMVYLAADRVGCDPDTIYNRRKKVKAVADAIEHARERFLDTAETALKRAVIQGEGWAVCFALKCQGKNRGYIERTELTGANGGRLDFSKVGDDELESFNRVLAAAVGVDGNRSLPAGENGIASAKNGALPH